MFECLFILLIYNCHSYLPIAIGPKTNNNQSKHEKSAELKEGWAYKLPLQYDDKTYGDRFRLQFFAEHLYSRHSF